MNPSQVVVIHFIGLVMWTSAVANDPGVHAILPRVQPSSVVADTDPHHHQRARGVAAFNTIEPHVGVLLFPASALHDDSNWPALPFALPANNPPFLHVALAGEHLNFITGAPNDPVTVKPTIPKLRCDNATGFIPGFQWPYAEAAAVVDVAEGEVYGCNATLGRTDSRLKLQTSGLLTIVGTKPGEVKTLVLKINSPTLVYLANVPAAYLEQGAAYTPTGDSHTLAYVAMLGKSKTNPCTAAAARRSAARPKPGPAIVATTNPQPCTEPPPLIPPGQTPPPRIPDPLPAIMGIVNSECSNTGWP